VYQQVKKALKNYGELMVMVSDGRKFELHLHNVKFEDSSKLIYIDGGKEQYWVDGQEILYYWIHKELE
jgi:hypothetical protein